MSEILMDLKEAHLYILFLTPAFIACIIFLEQRQRARLLKMLEELEDKMLEEFKDYES